MATIKQVFLPWLRCLLCDSCPQLLLMSVNKFVRLSSDYHFVVLITMKLVFKLTSVLLTVYRVGCGPILVTAPENNVTVHRSNSISSIMLDDKLCTSSGSHQLITFSSVQDRIAFMYFSLVLFGLMTSHCVVQQKGNPARSGLCTGPFTVLYWGMLLTRATRTPMVNCPTGLLMLPLKYHTKGSHTLYSGHSNAKYF